MPPAPLRVVPDIERDAIQHPDGPAWRSPAERAAELRARAAAIEAEGK